MEYLSLSVSLCKTFHTEDDDVFTNLSAAVHYNLNWSLENQNYPLNSLSLAGLCNEVLYHGKSKYASEY